MALRGFTGLFRTRPTTPSSKLSFFRNAARNNRYFGLTAFTRAQGHGHGHGTQLQTTNPLFKHEETQEELLLKIDPNEPGIGELEKITRKKLLKKYGSPESLAQKLLTELEEKEAVNLNETIKEGENRDAAVKSEPVGLESLETGYHQEGFTMFHAPLMLKGSYFGTLDNPVLIPSVNDSRIIACVGGPGPLAHEVKYHVIYKAKPNLICLECAQVFKMVSYEEWNEWVDKEVSKGAKIDDLFDPM
eukprot:TRINITY_DN1_c0_g2_i1.p1 TRINITY_DN1_c0_g2~~TRINITY_DN1_c0_g2_i1.p1  ORF type:complete len:246 (-),score=39.64 TRINITY_DN1_c0_g2_i1:145-882(-)